MKVRAVKPDEPIRVLVMLDKPDHASSDLRGIFPLHVLEQAGLAVVGVHTIHEVINPDNPASVDPESADSKIREFARDVNLCDIILVPQTTSIAWGSMIPVWQEQGKVVIMDTDDDIRYVSPLSPSYLSRGTQEVTITFRLADGTTKKVPLWKDGKECGDKEQFGGEKEGKAPSAKFSIAHNKMVQGVYLSALRSADAVFCPTARYADIIHREINPNSFALPNCLDLNTWKPREEHPQRPGFRICWHGGDSHRMDVMEAAEGVGKFMETHKDATFVLVGADLKEWLMHIPPDQLEFWEWGSYDAHAWRLQALGIDVGLCPVADHKFNHAKSPLKWVEFGALGIPVICTNHPPYSDAVRDGEDGLLVAHEPSAWLEALNRVYADQHLRKKLGAGVRARVEQDYDIWQKAVEWNTLFRRLLEEKRARVIEVEAA